MASEAAKLLDELMGRNRNRAPTENAREPRWEDPEVCKYALCGFCPHDLFVNTRADLGVCEKIHDDELRKSYQKSSRSGKMGYEEDFLRFLQDLLSDVERRIKKGQSRLALNNAQASLSSGPQFAREEKITMLTEKINDLVQQAEELGCQGNVEQAQGVLKLCEKLKEERGQLENSTLNMLPQPKEMEVCSVCGAFLVVDDVQQRIEEHLSGKQHMGYAKLRAMVDEMKKKLHGEDAAEREARLKKEREEYDKLKEERRKKEDKEKEEREKKKKRSRSRSRSRRSRSRDRRRRSRSRDRKRRSRSRDRHSRHRSRSRDRHSKRSHRSRSKDRKSRDKESSSRDKDRGKDRDRERRSSRSRDKDRSRSSKDGDRSSRDRDRTRSSRDRDRSRDRRSRDKDRGKSYDKDRKEKEATTKESQEPYKKPDIEKETTDIAESAEIVESVETDQSREDVEVKDKKESEECSESMEANEEQESITIADNVESEPQPEPETVEQSNEEMEHSEDTTEINDEN